MNTIEERAPTERRRRRRYSEQFKTEVVAACGATGVSVAAVAMEHTVEANLLRRSFDHADGRLPPDMPGRPAEVQTLPYAMGSPCSCSTPLAPSGPFAYEPEMFVAFVLNTREYSR